MGYEKKIVLFGAGNIGRSFIGQVFSRGGYEVVFADIDERVVNELNKRRSYDVVIKSTGEEDRVIKISNVRAVNARDKAAVAAELATAAYGVTSVGKNALKAIVPVIADGLRLRAKNAEPRDLDIILAENALEAADIVRDGLAAQPGCQDIVKAGLVETSIGKMVPIMPEEIKAKDPLVVYAEPYNTLIVSKKNFLTALPDVPDLKPVDDINAYVARKLYMHNLGHAASAYLGNAAYPESKYIWEVLADKNIHEAVRECLLQSAVAMSLAYRDTFTISELVDHAYDLLHRFQNKALGDTVFRVGRDLKRKLDKTDRLIGAMLQAVKMNCPFSAIAQAAKAAFVFTAKDELGNQAPGDNEVKTLAEEKGIRCALEIISGLDKNDTREAAIINAIADSNL
jgi:mannitol-1-phosphate 5-dehydrogenase